MADATPILYLLKTDFRDQVAGEGKFYCPFCIRIEGMISAFPIIRESIRIQYVGFEKPRGTLANHVEEADQSCPQLVFPNGDDQWSVAWSLPAKRFARKIDSTDHIQDYFSTRFGLSKRHP